MPLEPSREIGNAVRQRDGSEVAAMEVLPIRQEAAE